MIDIAITREWGDNGVETYEQDVEAWTRSLYVNGAMCERDGHMWTEWVKCERRCCINGMVNRERVVVTCEWRVVVWTWWDVNRMATCEWGGHDVVWTGCGHVNGMVTCESGCDHIWTGYGHVWTRCGCMNEVVTCERVRSNVLATSHVMVTYEPGCARVNWLVTFGGCGHAWTGCGRMSVWTRSGVIYFISIFWLYVLQEE